MGLHSDRRFGRMSLARPLAQRELLAFHVVSGGELPVQAAIHRVSDHRLRLHGLCECPRPTVVRQASPTQRDLDDQLLTATTMVMFITIIMEATMAFALMAFRRSTTDFRFSIHRATGRESVTDTRQTMTTCMDLRR